MRPLHSFAWLALLTLPLAAQARVDATPAAAAHAVAAHAAARPADPPPAVVLPAHPQGQIESATSVADPTFGIHARVLGLERGVEMLQWRKVDFPLPPHYEQAWTAERVDASGFDAAHRNPGELPFNGERWWTTDPKLDGQPVSPDVLAALDAWTALKPDLAQLPTNLAVSFQPDGDWLSTSQDPAHPQVGDVRVRWRSMLRAAAPAGVVLVAGRWELHPASAVATAPSVPVHPAAASPGAAPGPSNGDMRAWVQRMFGDHLAWLVVGGICVALLLLVWRRRR